MRKLALTALAGIAAIAATAMTPSKADAQIAIGVGIGAPGGYVSGGYATPVQWGGYPGGGYYRGGGYYGGGYRPYRPYGFYRPYRPAYVAPTCWVERRWVDTPWGPRPRPVRICR